MSKETTKTALLEAGEHVFLERGFSSAGLDGILRQAGVPKGSFYYYFSSKEEFGLQVIDHFASHYNACLEESFGDLSLSPLERVRRHFESGVRRLASGECRNGCLIGRLSQEMADQSEVFRARLEQVFAGWVDRLADCLREAQQAGEISTTIDPQQIAEFWLHSWQGAVLRAKTARSTAPLTNVLDVMFDRVLQVP